jgi:hypothetical protein
MQENGDKTTKPTTKHPELDWAWVGFLALLGVISFATEHPSAILVTWLFTIFTVAYQITKKRQLESDNEHFRTRHANCPYEKEHLKRETTPTVQSGRRTHLPQAGVEGASGPSPAQWEIKKKQRYCGECDRNTLHQATIEKANIGCAGIAVHLVLCVVTCGLWLPVFLTILYLGDFRKTLVSLLPKYHCQVCGRRYRFQFRPKKKTQGPPKPLDSTSDLPRAAS